MIGSMKRFAFSFIELLIVLGIVAALTAIALPFFSGQVEEAKYATARENHRILNKALDDFKGDHGRYPRASTFFTEKNELLRGREGLSTSFSYLREIPKDPFTGSSGTWKIFTHNDPVVGAVVGSVTYSLDDPLLK